MSGHPFLFLGHGSTRESKAQECDVWFKSAVPPEVRAEIEALLPDPLSSFAHWRNDNVRFGSGDDFQYLLQWTYGSRGTWERFQWDFDDRLARIHERFPIAFAVQPGVYAHGGVDDWNEWSVARLTTEALPRVASYFVQTPPPARETRGIGTPSWTLASLFGLQAASRPLPLLAAVDRAVWLETLNLSAGYSAYIDRTNAERWRELSVRGDLATSVNSEVLLSYYASSDLAAQELTERRVGTEHVARLIRTCRRAHAWWQREQLARIAELVAMRDRTLAAGLVELTFDGGFSQPDDWVAVTTNYALAGRWQRALELSRTALSRWPGHQAIRANLVWAAAQAGDTRMLAEQLEWAEFNEITNASLLQNLLYATNEAGDFERSCRLADRFRQPPAFGSGAHYVNMINAYLGCESPQRGEWVVKEVESRLLRDPFFAAQFPVLFHSLASYYAKVDDLERVMSNLRLAKSHRYSHFTAISRDPDFASFRADGEFEELFA